MTLYELTTGRHPVETESTVALMQAIAGAEAPRPSTICPNVPAALDELLSAMLAPTPELRPTAQQVSDKLAAIATQSYRRPAYGFWLALTGLLCLAAIVAAFGLDEPQPVAEPQWLGRPVTFDPGDEFGASFSPDGTRIVFAWRPEEENFLNLFEQPLSGGTRRRLTSAPIRHLQSILVARWALDRLRPG